MVSISAKITMALSGLFLISFLVVHLLGNLQIFNGPDVFNDYAETLQEFPKLLWCARIVLLSAFIIHIYLSIRLNAKNKAAKPIQYSVSAALQTSYASKTMLMGGLSILGFIIFHLIHLTWRLVFTEISDLDIYSFTVLSFQNVLVSGFYILAQIFLALHISHGFSSAAQTLSLTRWHAIWLRKFGYFFAVLLMISYISIPVSILLGLVNA